MNPTESVAAINKVKVLTVSPAEQERRTEEAIARRAYEIFERRGGMGWHELEDWRQAESEVRSKLCFSLSTSHDSVSVGFDVARFEPGSVEAWIAPRQITICGRPIRRMEQAETTRPSYEGTVYRTITLPMEVEASRSLAKARRCFVEIRLPLTRVTYGEGRPAQAA